MAPCAPAPLVVHFDPSRPPSSDFSEARAAGVRALFADFPEGTASDRSDNKDGVRRAAGALLGASHGPRKTPDGSKRPESAAGAESADGADDAGAGGLRPPAAVGAALRLAGLHWLYALYRRNGSLLPPRVVQQAADSLLPRLDDPVDFDSLPLAPSRGAEDPAGPPAGSDLLFRLLPDLEVAPQGVPALLVPLCARALASHCCLVASQISLIAIALTAEVTAASGVRDVKTVAAVEGCDPVIRSAAATLLWLLDDSKIVRPLRDSGPCWLAAAARGAARLQAAAGRLDKSASAALKLAARQYAEKLPNIVAQLNFASFDAADLESCVRAAAEESRRRLETLLLPRLAERAAASPPGGRDIPPWPAAVPLPDQCEIPECADAAARFLALFEKAGAASPRAAEAANSQRGQLGGCVASPISEEFWHDQVCAPLHQAIDDLALRLRFELGGALSLMTELEFDMYVAAAGRAKKSQSFRLHIGRPLRAALSALFAGDGDGGGVLPPADPAAVAAALAANFAFPRCLALAPALTAALSAGNQQGRLPKIAKGTQDTEPRRMVIRTVVIEKLKALFRLYGGEEIDTPVFELRETLMGKYGEDQKLIFDLKDQGGEQLALRYDLTVPFARYCASNNVEKMRRFHIGKVYRRDEPQMHRGRFREFYQCDYDIAGAHDPMVPEAEILTLLVDFFSEMRDAVGPFSVRLNHRALLDAIMHVCGVPPAAFRKTCAAIDKLDKSPWENVKQEMVQAKGLSAAAADAIKTYIDICGSPEEVLAQLEADAALRSGAPRCSGDGSAAGAPLSADMGAKASAALAELRLLFKYLSSTSALRAVKFDLSLARGLDYYTGVIYEVVLTGQDLVGSVGGGGRYDDLIGMFKGRQVPAVGVSVGVERLFRIIETNLARAPPAAPAAPADPAAAGAGLSKKIASCPTEVFVCSVGAGLMHERLAIARRLRAAGVAADLAYSDKMKAVKQLAAATERRARWTVFFGTSELERGVVKLKQLVYEEGEKREGGNGDVAAPHPPSEEEVAVESLVPRILELRATMPSLQTQVERIVFNSS